MSCRTLIKFRNKWDKNNKKNCLIDCSFVMHEMYSETVMKFSLSQMSSTSKRINDIAHGLRKVLY